MNQAASDEILTTRDAIESQLPLLVSTRDRIVTTLAISAAGLLGAECRYAIGRWAVRHWGDAFPWGTLIINLAGSFVLGFYLTIATERFTARPATRLFVATGFLGAFTTFSTFSYEWVTLLRDGEIALAIVYIGASLILGLIAGIAGRFAALLPTSS